MGVISREEFIATIASQYDLHMFAGELTDSQQRHERSIAMWLIVVIVPSSATSTSYRSARSHMCARSERHRRLVSRRSIHQSVDHRTRCRRFSPDEATASPSLRRLRKRTNSPDKEGSQRASDRRRIRVASSSMWMRRSHHSCVPRRYRLLFFEVPVTLFLHRVTCHGQHVTGGR